MLRDNIRQLIKLRNLKQHVVANRLNVSLRGLQKMMFTNKFQDYILDDLAEILEVTKEDLYNDMLLIEKVSEQTEGNKKLTSTLIKFIDNLQKEDFITRFQKEQIINYVLKKY